MRIKSKKLVTENDDSLLYLMIMNVRDRVSHPTLINELLEDGLWYIQNNNDDINELFEFSIVMSLIMSINGKFKSCVGGTNKFSVDCVKLPSGSGLLIVYSEDYTCNYIVFSQESLKDIENLL